MKMNKMIIAGILWLLLLPLLNGQDDAPHRDRRHHERHANLQVHLDKLSQELSLTDEQIVEIKAILQEAHPKKEKGAKHKDRPSHEERDAQRDAVHAKIKKVLQPDQLQKFEAMEQEREEMEQKRLKVHEDIQAYKDQNMTPVLKAQRLKLENQLSQDEKNLIARIKEGKNDLKSKRGDMGNMDKKKKAHSSISKEDQKAFAMLIADKKESIDALHQEISEDEARWKDDIDAIRKANGLDDQHRARKDKMEEKEKKVMKNDKKREHKKHTKDDMKKDDMKKDDMKKGHKMKMKALKDHDSKYARFLLMDIEK